MISRIIPRKVEQVVVERLGQFPAVALLGPRQVGKTTLAQGISRGRDSVYLDLERPSDRAKLVDPELYLSQQAGKLVILDEVHRAPELFAVLRGVIDDRRSKGLRTGQFLLLGSASIDLLQQTSESLAGRIAFVELPPLTVSEVGGDASGEVGSGVSGRGGVGGMGGADTLWLRGGFPDSFAAADDRQSFAWREQFIRTYLERDIPQLGPRVPAETLRRFWTMLCHTQGGLLNAAELARSLAVDGKTVARYLDLLVDLLLVRRLEPRHANVGKRLVKSPKVYVRDSGIVHALLGLPSREDVLGHPVAGASWEGFVIENLLAAAPESTRASFYRTFTGAEMDLVLELPGGKIWAVEIKRGLTPKLTKGFRHAHEDLKPERAFVIYSGQERYPKGEGVEVVGLGELARILAKV